MNTLKLVGWLLWLTCLVSFPAQTQTIIPVRLLGQYQQVVWQDQQGLPQNGISAIVQTPDGYLWLATAEGVVRFDGVRFTTFDPFNTNEIKSGNIMSLLVTRAGALWIGTHGGGVTRYQDGRFTLYSTNEGLSDTHARSLFEDHAGNVWVGTDGGGVNLFRDGRFVVFSTANGLPDNRIFAFAEDAAGNLWVGTNGGLARLSKLLSEPGAVATASEPRSPSSTRSLPPAALTTYTTKDGLPSDQIRALRFDHEGALWIGMQSGLSRMQNGRIINTDAPEELKRSNVHAITQDREGGIWFGVFEGGLYRLKDGRYEACSAKEGLAGNGIKAISQDQSGDLWIGTSGSGLIQLRTGRFRVYSEADGLPDLMIRAIYEDQAAGIWIGTEEGLARFKEGRFTVYATSDGRSLRSIAGITSDHDGNLLIKSSRAETGTQILRFREGSSVLERVRESPVKTASVILQTQSGDVWFGTSYDGLHRVRGDQTTIYHKQDGLADDYVQVLFEDRSHNLWIGTRNGITRFKDEKLTSWSLDNGFAARLVWSFYEDRTGALWIGTDGDGLLRFKDGKFAVITSRNGLYDNLAFQILEDDNGNLWMSGNKGIYRASLKELNDFCDGRSATVNSFSYGAADGMLSRECNGANPAGIKARDGRLWFPTIKGVVVVEPREFDELPPRVVIEQASLDGTVLSVGQQIQIKPGQENLEIQYTALSWSRAPQVRFKYEMAGLNDLWIDAGTRRTAYFAHLPPGSYTFRVIADNGEGVWNMEGKSLRIVVLPPFYRTWWFMTLLGLLVIGLGVYIYRTRINQLEKRRRAQEEFAVQLLASQEQERKRIAAELHDSLGQNLLVIKNRAAIAKVTSQDLPAAFQQFDQIADSAMNAIQEVRQIAYNLRPHHLDNIGLTRSLEEMLRRVEEASGVVITVEIESLDGFLPKEAEINFYRIIQEVVSNIVKHAHATRAGIEIERLSDRLAVNIRDNGCGFDLHDTSERRGFGLASIAERVRILSGHYRVDSESGKGTTISIEIPPATQVSQERLHE
jgi:ligand-binding sensor domain-containing protein/signal transduction histidine kinase